MAASDHSITFGKKNTWADWHLVPSTRPLFLPPSTKTQYQDIPGADFDLDLTEVLGGVPVYNAREGSNEFYVMNGYGSWESKYSEIMNYLHGKRMKAVLADDPGYYYEGRFSVNTWRSEKDWSKIVIDYHVDPYKYEMYSSTEDWLWDPFNFESGVIREYKDLEVAGTYTLTIPGTRKRIVPVFTVGALQDLYPEWKPNTAYAKQDRVRYNNKYYLCAQAHTSQSGQEPPNASTLWTEVEPAITPDTVTINASTQDNNSSYTTAQLLKIIALGVWYGKYGTGATRKSTIESMGYNYSDVQTQVNALASYYQNGDGPDDNWFTTNGIPKDWMNIEIPQGTTSSKTTASVLPAGTIKGVDLYSGTGRLTQADFEMLKKNYGIEFVIMRVGYGVSHHDNMTNNAGRRWNFYYNYQNARAAGMKIGLYHFSYAGNGTRGEQEAEFVLKALNGGTSRTPKFKETDRNPNTGESFYEDETLGEVYHMPEGFYLDLPIFFDHEVYNSNGGDGTVYDGNGAPINNTRTGYTEAANAFCNYIENYSTFKAGIYANTDYCKRWYNFGDMTKYDENHENVVSHEWPLWLAQYGVSQPNYTGRAFGIWQYKETSWTNLSSGTYALDFNELYDYSFFTTTIEDGSDIDKAQKSAVTPAKSTSDGLTLTFGGKNYKLKNGSHRYPEIVIGEGENKLIFSGYGSVTVDYRGAIL